MTNWITNINASNAQEANDAVHLISRSLCMAAQEIGFQEINLVGFQYTDAYPERRQNLVHALLDPVQPGDLVVVQFPLFTTDSFTETFFDQLFHRQGVQKVAVIRDIPSWMNAVDSDGYDAQTDWWLTLLRRFDLLIVANEQEAAQLRRDGVNVPMISLVICDYLYQGPWRKKQFRKELYYASGRDILGLDYHAATPLNVYSAVASDAVQANGSTRWLGFQPSDAILASLSGGFGIVTANNIRESHDEAFKYYTQFNDPTKLSFYWAAGLPVVTTSRTPHAQLIKDRHLGLVVDDLNDIDRILSDMSSADYQAMVTAVAPWQRAVTTGFFIKRALMAAIQTLNLGVKQQLVKSWWGLSDNSNTKKLWNARWLALSVQRGNYFESL